MKVMGGYPMWRRFVMVMAIGMTLLGLGSLAVSADGPKGKAAKEAKAAAKNPIPAEHEAVVRAFVILNHRELDDVLTKLKSASKPEYEKAVRQIYVYAERLNRLKEDDPERHEIELRLWKIDSRVRLLTARMTVAESDDAQDELKKAVTDEFDAKADMLKLEHRRYSARLKKLEAELARLEKSGTKDADVSIRLTELKKEIGRTKPKGKAAAGKTSGS